MKWVDYAGYLDQRPTLACVLVFLSGLAKLATLISPFFLPLSILTFLGLSYAALATLSGRYRLGFILFILIILPADGLSYWILHAKQIEDPVSQHLGFLSGLGVLSTLLIYVGAILFSKRAEWGAWLEVMALGFALLIAILHGFHPAISEFWSSLLFQMQTWNTKASALSSQGGGLSELQIQAIQIVKLYMTGLVATVVLLSTLFLVGFARAWQSALNPALAFRVEIANVRFQYLTGILFLAALIASYYDNQVVLDMMPVLVFIFFLSGLSYVHFLFQQWSNPNSRIWLVCFYMLIVIVAGVSIKFLAGLGLMDVFLNFRQNRVAKN